MKRIAFIFLIILPLFPVSTEAALSKYVGVGLTRATLRAQGGKSEWGKFIGIGLEYSGPFSLYFATEASYATKKVTLENKTWPTDFDPSISDVSVGNINIHGLFIELAAKIGYHIRVVGNQVSIKLFLGPGVSRQLKYIDIDNRADSTIFLAPEERGKYKFDYLREESEGLPESSINFIIGGSISYRSVGIEVKISRALTARKALFGLNINDKIDCSYISLYYNF